MIDLPGNRQIIDNAPTAEDIFIDDDLFSDEDIEDDSKQIIDFLSKDVIYGDILMKYVLPDTKIKVE